MPLVFALLLVVFPLVGVAARRWLALLLPAIGWPLYYVGLDRGWWGSGTGDGWQYLALVFTTVGVVSTAVAVAAARRVSLRPDPVSSPVDRARD
jgi:hypothetical protein